MYHISIIVSQALLISHHIKRYKNAIKSISVHTRQEDFVAYLLSSTIFHFLLVALYSNLYKRQT